MQAQGAQGPGAVPRLILASASPRRRELLRTLGIPFEVVTAPVEEHLGEQLTGRETALGNAHRKALAVARQFPDCVVLGADTVVCLGAVQFAKPADLDEAARFLQALAGRTHEVITGVCLLQLRPFRRRLFSDTSLVTFKPLNPEQIAAYHARVNPLDKAGAYAIQEEGDRIIERVEGSWSNIVGLPLERLREELAAGWPEW
ncbi:MAG: septum formation protein Maf, partial [Verrucomicrobia bacterium]